MKAAFYVDIKPQHSGVTGSCFFLQAMFPNRTSYSCIIDCGLFQGKEESKQNEYGLQPYLKDAGTLILTHNHVDHIGKVPQLVSNGFRGKIITSEQTFGLLSKAWIDCEKIEKLNASKQKRTPHFNLSHVSQAVRRVTPFKFGERRQIHSNIWVTLLKNGHVYGAAMVLMEIVSGSAEHQPINFLFTGDYNDKNYFFNVPEMPPDIRSMPLHIICEATYGENARQASRGRVFKENISKQIALNRQVLIPTFAFERGQVVLYTLKKMQDAGRLDVNVPIFLDGKLFRGYTAHYVSVANREFDKINKEDILPQNIRWVTNPNQRRGIINSDNCQIIVTTGGMLSHGPSQAYSPYFIQNPSSAIHFTGYQCEGSLGNKLKVASETDELLDLRGKLARVECAVFYTEEFSAHALLEPLLQLIGSFANVKSISLNHGSQLAKQNFAKRIVQANLAKEVGIFSRGNAYRFSPYKLEKVFPAS